MFRKRPIRRRQEILARSFRVKSISMSAFIHADKPRGLPSRFESTPWIELRGESDKPLRDVRQFSVGLHMDDQTEPGPVMPPSVGAILQLKPEVQAVVSMQSADFDRVWALAASGKLRYCRLAFTEPFRGAARIVSASFSTEEHE